MFQGVIASRKCNASRWNRECSSLVISIIGKVSYFKVKKKKKRERKRENDRQTWLMFYLINDFFDCTKSDNSGFPLIISTLVACISLWKTWINWNIQNYGITCMLNILFNFIPKSMTNVVYLRGDSNLSGKSWRSFSLATSASAPNMTTGLTNPAVTTKKSWVK